MTGRTLQEKVKVCGKKQTEIAEALGVSPQGLSSIFRAESVKTDTIETIARISGKPISWFFDQDPTTYITASADGAIVTGDSNLVGCILILGEPYTYGQQSGATITIPTSVLLLLQRQLEEKDQQIAQLLRQLSR